MATGTAAVVVGLLGLGPMPALAEDTIGIATSGGLVADAGRAALWGPATEKLGLKYLEDTITEGLNSVRLQVNANNVTYDLAQMANYEAALGGNEGILAPIDYSIVSKDGFEGTATDFCVGYQTYTFSLAWNTKTFGKDGPQNWADFWDVKKFPGTRAMRANAEAQLEAALMADGVAPGDVYKVLGAEGGLERAIAKLEELKPHVAVWWKSGAQVAQLLRDGEVDMSTGWNGRFQAVQKDGGPTDFTWNQGILGVDCFAIPKGAPHFDKAMQVLAEMALPAPQAEMAVRTSYGPGNSKAFETGIISQDVIKLLPNFPENAKTQITLDPDWWAANNNRAQKLFDEMLTR
jgi:putative spermidine/putrescine transport system substrate-binding protein